MSKTIRIMIAFETDKEMEEEFFEDDELPTDVDGWARFLQNRFTDQVDNDYRDPIVQVIDFANDEVEDVVSIQEAVVKAGWVNA